MVRGPTPNHRVICLLLLPLTISVSTSRSREVRSSHPSNAANTVNALIAARTLETIVLQSNGFSMKSHAPLRIASTAVAMSAWPYIATIGAGNLMARPGRWPLLPCARISRRACGLLRPWSATLAPLLLLTGRQRRDMPFSSGVADLGGLIDQCSHRTSRGACAV